MINEQIKTNVFSDEINYHISIFTKQQKIDSDATIYKKIKEIKNILDKLGYTTNEHTSSTKTTAFAIIKLAYRSVNTHKKIRNDILAQMAGFQHHTPITLRTGEIKKLLRKNGYGLTIIDGNCKVCNKPTYSKTGQDRKFCSIQCQTSYNNKEFLEKLYKQRDRLLKKINNIEEMISDTKQTVETKRDDQ